jgi:ABC-type nitrate/sulfonate/bicarbonate transport system substrate-binding protein
MDPPAVRADDGVVSQPPPSRDSAAAADPASVAAQVATAKDGSPAGVLILLAKPEVKSVAELSDKPVLVAGVAAGSVEELKSALAAAGASGAEVKQGGKDDMAPLARGEVAAVIVGVVASEAAASLRDTDYPGYRVLRVDLPPRANP